ncbi:MAG: flagellar hook protein FlgE [Rubrivivax sp.]
MGFQQGLSGLNATSKNLEIIGNNIANANTYGAKSSRAEFSDMYANAINGAGSNAIGIGTNLAAVAQQFTPGSITNTGNALDLAINGSGFFQLADPSGPIHYSRNGQFKIDRDGFIVNNQEQKLMGYAADASGVILPGTATPLQLPTAGIAPAQTTRVTMELNLDSRAKVTNPGAGVVPQIDFNNPDTYNNATSVTVFDAKGQDMTVTYYFQKVDTDQWNIFVTANGEPIAGTPADPGPLTATPISFLSDGSGASIPVSALPVSIGGPITTSSGAAIVTPMSFDLNMSRATQYGASFGVTDMVQDGYAPGQLTNIAIESTGVITARYSNGQSKPAGQLELANFRSPQGLQSMGGNSWTQTFASGPAVTGVPNEGNMGVIQAGALEESNVDLTGELVSMITAQRVYQANAQSIKTEDQILQTIVNLR